MYCPWDVLSYVKSVQDGSFDPEQGPESYWLNTSETSANLIHGFLGKTAGVNEDFEQLLAGETIACEVNEYVSYHKILENGENLWSALVETGYLTKGSGNGIRPAGSYPPDGSEQIRKPSANRRIYRMSSVRNGFLRKKSPD